MQTYVKTLGHQRNYLEEHYCEEYSKESGVRSIKKDARFGTGRTLVAPFNGSELAIHPCNLFKVYPGTYSNPWLTRCTGKRNTIAK